MKRFLAILLSVILVFTLSSCGFVPDVILDNSEKSRFIDFYTEGEYVYIECELNIYAEEATEIKLSATDIDNVETGLLKNEKLIGIDKTDSDEVFSLKEGENKVTVLFKGEYAGAFMISKRDIPRFIKIEKK